MQRIQIIAQAQNIYTNQDVTITKKHIVHKNNPTQWKPAEGNLISFYHKTIKCKLPSEKNVL